MIREVITVEGRDEASEAFDKTGGSFDNLTGKIGKFAKGAVAGAAAAKFVQLGSQLVGMAIDAGEAASAFETTFGEGVGAASDFVDEFANKAGFARHELQQMLATTGNVAQGIGATEVESAALAEQMARLAGDVSSFSNASGGAEAVLAALQSAMTGEREALKTYGIAVSETEVQERALQMTQKSRADELTRLEKAEATMALATEKAGKAVGDLDRTSESAANKIRAIQAEMKEAGTAAGASMLPALESLLPVVSDLIPIVGEVAGGIGSVVAGIAPLVKIILNSLNPALQAAGAWFELVGKGLTSIAALAGDEGAKNTLRMGEAVEYMNAQMEGNEDAATALANSLLHIARDGELTSAQFEELAEMSGLSEDRLRDVQLALLDYARTSGGTEISTMELNDAFGETVATGLDYVDAAERMARQTRDVADAADDEASPALVALRERMAEAAREAYDMAETLREDVAGEMLGFASGVEEAVELAEISLDEFFDNFTERHEQQRAFWSNLALLYAHGFDVLADELAEGGVENAGLVADAVADMEEAARLDDLIRNAETDIDRWSRGISDAMGSSSPKLLDMFYDFGFDLARLTAAGFDGFDLASKLDTLIDQAVGSSAARAAETGSNRTRDGDTITTPGGATAFASGGIVGGPMGAPMQAVVHGGEEVFSIADRRDMIDAINRLASSHGGGGDVAVRIILEGGRDDVSHVETEAQSASLSTTVERLVR